MNNVRLEVIIVNAISLPGAVSSKTSRFTKFNL